MKWLSSLCIFSLCLLPLQCCLLLGGSYLLFFLLMFLPSYCFNNVKSQVLACYLELLSICFPCYIFLAAVLFLSFFLSLVFWYFVSVNAKLSINCRLQERIAGRKEVQQWNRKLSCLFIYYYICTHVLCFPATFLYNPLFTIFSLLFLISAVS